VQALPVAHGRRLGVVFVQPLIDAEQAGVAFFDGFYYERSVAAGSNEAITSGTARGETDRGHQQRDEPWSAWLQQVFATQARRGAFDAVDLEFCVSGGQYTLLQVRPALFQVRRNRTLSLANHKEILGDPPSPWSVSVMVEGGARSLDVYTAVDPGVAAWEEPYAVALAERAWMNFSFFFRLMDHWGLPRTLVTRGIGGADGGPADHQVAWGKALANAPRFAFMTGYNLWTVWRGPRQLAALDAEIAATEGLEELYDLNVQAMYIGLRTTFTINGLLSGISMLRRFLRVRGSADVITHRMMQAYEDLRALPKEDRAAGLKTWLERYGHRGPLETDLKQPRFHELEQTLLADLLSSGAVSPSKGASSHLLSGITRPFFWIDQRREWFRDQLMQRWALLRPRVLVAAQQRVDRGELETAEDVFWLRGEDLRGDKPLRDCVIENRRRVEAVEHRRLPHTASRDVITAALTETAGASAVAHTDVFHGIALSPKIIEGRVLKGTSLTAVLEVLSQQPLDEPTILVVPALEPSWAVAFSRFAGVIAELGGEMSHASILLREAGKPAIVNCNTIFEQLNTGDRVRIDGQRAVVERL